MKSRLCLLASVAAVAALTTFTQASSVSFDQNLVSPNSTTTTNPIYFGTGNPNGGFTVDNESGIELGLRAKYRQNGSVIDSSTNLYNVVSGPETLATSGGVGAAPTRAAWNYEFSIDLQPKGVGSLTLADITANTTITVTDLTTSTTLLTGNLFGFFTDSTTFGAGGATSHNGTTSTAAGATSDWGAQNSESPSFLPGFNMNAPDLYQVTVNVVNSGGTTLASDTINVQVAPLPSAATMGLGMLALLGAAGLIRRKLQTA
jgi:hypothetical protein